MKKFIKGAFHQHYPDIPHWDAPVDREFNGQKISGRPTKAYGYDNFEYAGKVYKPEPWSYSIEPIKWAVETLVFEELGRAIDFNFCLCGMYKNGRIAIPHHSDTVPRQKDLVVSISFGSPRVFEWREYSNRIKAASNTSKIDRTLIPKLKETTQYLMENGDVFIFDGASQMTATHAVPPLKGTGERINLTFRTGI
jgi:alkylated DNA repair dioxygenase AlkB|tara:strand:- start:260 stop:844 length:585 start_codon:yes stop_codon:yes gene_type:complete